MAFPVISMLSMFSAGNAQIDSLNLRAQSKEPQSQVLILEKQAQLIDDYFALRDAPLSGYGKTFVEIAIKYDLDYRLLPAMAQRESSGGRNDCQSVPNNPFGWTSCKYGFPTMENAIETVAKNIAGENEKTARYYAGKSIRDRLIAYNGVGVVPEYPNEVFLIMSKIGPEEL